MSELYDEKKERILDLLSAEEIEKQFLSIGFSAEHNIFWFGFKLDGYDSIVTSEGKVLQNTFVRLKEQTVGKNEIEELFKYDDTIGDIAPRISNAAISKFITKEPGQQLVNPKELYRRIWNVLTYYMDYGQEEIADTKTLWIMGTYCYPLFYWFPHMLNWAPTESGKTKDLFIMTQLSFGGFDLGASAGVTPAQVYRTIETNRGMILMDEYEQLDSEAIKLVNQILNSSAARGAYIIRSEQDKNKKWVAKRFPIFCPKACGNISGMNNVSLSRFIPFNWLKTASDKGHRRPEREKDRKIFPPLRDELHFMILENWQAIKDIYDSLEIPDLENRQHDNWLPLFAIARFIDSYPEGEPVNAEKHLREYIESCKDVHIETNDTKPEFFAMLYEFVSDVPTEYQPKEIAACPEIAELLAFMKGPAHWIGKCLSSYKFKKLTGGGVNRYLLSKEIVESIIKLYFPKITLHNDTNTTNPTNNTNHTNPT